MPVFFSCDWGTSFLRVRLVETPGLNILAKEKSDEGISNTYALWKNSDSKSFDNQTSFYLNILRKKIEVIEKKLNRSFQGTPVVVSGMASSSIGMLNIPYAGLPYSVEGNSAKVEHIKPGKYFNHPVLVISGIKSNDDVMRGEETQLTGVVSQGRDKEEGIYVFPGTHSKHITVKNGEVSSFKTYMTGEFFDLLSKKSVLASSVEKTEGVLNDRDVESFRNGAAHAIKGNLLHTAFHVRTNDLFERISKKSNLNFLSGLLIGSELKDLPSDGSKKTTLCCSSGLRAWYKAALQPLGLEDKVLVLPAQVAEEAVVVGQYKIFTYQNMKNEA